MDEGRKRVLAIVAGILVARHLKTTEDLFDRPSPRTEAMVAAVCALLVVNPPDYCIEAVLRARIPFVVYRGNRRRVRSRVGQFYNFCRMYRN